MEPNINILFKCELNFWILKYKTIIFQITLVLENTYYWASVNDTKFYTKV